MRDPRERIDWHGNRFRDYTVVYMDLGYWERRARDELLSFDSACLSSVRPAPLFRLADAFLWKCVPGDGGQASVIPVYKLKHF